VKDENGDFLADSHNILNRWNNYFSQLLNVHNVSDDRQIEVHMAEPLIPGSSHLKVEIAIAKFNKYNLPGSNQILEELIQVGGETLLFQFHELINSVWNKEELPDQWKKSVHKKGDKTGCINYRGISLISASYNILMNILLSRLSPDIDEITGEYNEIVHQLFIGFKNVYDSMRREVLYNIFIEFGLPMKLVRLIKMSLNKTYSEVHIGRHLFDSFPVQNGLKQADALP
jgi:hypothetical protein